MKALFLISLVISISAFSQTDSIRVTSGGFSFPLPVNAAKDVVYQRVYEFDSSVKQSQIFSVIKTAFSDFYSNTSVGLNDQNNVFKIYQGNPIVSEDKQEGKITLQMGIRSVKQKNDPSDIKPDINIFYKSDFIVKGNKLKVTVRDVDTYFTSAGMAILFGTASSLLNMPFQNIKTLPIAKGSYKTTDYVAKRLYTADYKIHAFMGQVPGRIIESIKNDSF